MKNRVFPMFAMSIASAAPCPAVVDGDIAVEGEAP